MPHAYGVCDVGYSQFYSMKTVDLLYKLAKNKNERVV